MSNTLEKLISDFSRRQALLRKDRNNYTYVIRDIDPESALVNAFTLIIQAVTDYSPLVDTLVRIGKTIQIKENRSRDDIEACHIGWFVFISYLELGLFDFKRKHIKGLKHPPYFAEINKTELVEELWYLIKDKMPDIFPSAHKIQPWKGPRHPLGHGIVKKSEPLVLKRFSPDKQPKVFKALNKLGSQGWIVNAPVLSVLGHFLDHNELDSPVNFKSELDERRRTSKRIEAESVFKVASKFVDSVFYHLYNTDFRGRIYTNTSWLHEQSSDTAKGLLLLAEPAPLGEEGLYWLYVHIANCMGKDKLPSLNDRVQFVEDNFNTILSFAEDPVSNTGWHAYDKPWSLLAAAIELKMISEYEGDLSEYLCHLPVFIDGTVSGTQHLVALSQDEELAPFVNLVHTEKPGDLYSKVAELVWKELDKRVKELDQGTLKRFSEIHKTAQELEEKYLKAPYNSQEKADAWQELARWQNHNRGIREKLFPVFWANVTDLKERRKVVKRVSMTLGYGVTAYGASQQIIDDAPSVSPYIKSGEKLWYAKLGRLIFDVCRTELKGPGRMLALFETLADIANEKGEYLSWVVPSTGFVVVQQYRKPEIKRTKLRYANRELKVQLESWIDASLNPSAQRAGAPPHLVQSLDAAHLTMVVAAVDYPIAVIHDSFGCTPGNMEHLFRTVREQFVELYKQDPLKNILNQLGADDLMPERGSLNIESILDSDFAFS